MNRQTFDEISEQAVNQTQPDELIEYLATFLAREAGPNDALLLDAIDALMLAHRLVLEATDRNLDRR